MQIKGAVLALNFAPQGIKGVVFELNFYNWQRYSKSLKSFQLLILSVQYPGCRDWCATANTTMPLA